MRALSKLFIGLVLFLPSALLAQDALLIVGPDKGEVGRSFDVDVLGMQMPLDIFRSKSPPQIVWKEVPEGSAAIRSHLEVKIEVISGKTEWVVVPYATITPNVDGKFGAVLMVVQDGIGQLAVHEVTVGPFPNPDPDPNPEPNPPPPVVESVWGFLLIEETSQRTPELAALITSKSLEKWMEGKKVEWLITDKDAKTKEGKTPQIIEQYMPNVEEYGGVPAIVVIGDKGTCLWCGPPMPEDEFKKFVQEQLKKHERKPK